MIDNRPIEQEPGVGEGDEGDRKDNEVRDDLLTCYLQYPNIDSKLLHWSGEIEQLEPHAGSTEGVEYQQDPVRDLADVA